MSSEKYPMLGFKLGNGRTIKVHAFIWEPSLPEVRKIVTSHGTKEIEVDRNRFKCSDVIHPSKTHVLDWDRLDKLPSGSSQFPNCTISVLLSSEPFAANALCSELAVIMFVDYVVESSMKSILESSLHDLDWENLAMDVAYHINELRSDSFLKSTNH